MRPETSGTPRPESMLSVGKVLRRKRHGHSDHGRGTRGGLGPEDGPAAVVLDPRPHRRQPGARREERRRTGAEAEQNENRAGEAAAAGEEEERGQQEQRQPGGREDRGVLLPEEEGHALFLRHGERRDPVGGIPFEEVEDLVAARIEARRERRPGHGRLRRDRRRQRRVSAPLPEGRERRKLTGRQHLLDQHRVHAVEAQDDDASRRRGRGRRGEQRRGGRRVERRRGSRRPDAQGKSREHIGELHGNDPVYGIRRVSQS